MPFMCSICGEESTRICARCTKDSCNNHLCEKCLCCSDCCECEVALSEAPHPMVRPVHRPVYGEDVVDEIEDDVFDVDEVIEEPAEGEPLDAAPVPAESTPPPSET
jgi:hypothetical protein